MLCARFRRLVSEFKLLGQSLSRLVLNQGFSKSKFSEWNPFHSEDASVFLLFTYETLSVLYAVTSNCYHDYFNSVPVCPPNARREHHSVGLN